MNCWEFKKCGREPKGSKEKELGVCPATTNFTYNNKNAGKGAGRYCWHVAGTFCGGKVQGTFSSKLANCSKCDFYSRVQQEQGATFVA
jgi:hypothetical protein